jgi:hypothetical protein
MALAQLDQTGFPGFSDAQIGSLAEERLASAILIDSQGRTAVGLPLLDLGFDLYPRRVRSLRACPTQVKARSFLSPSGEFQAGVASLHPDPSGAVLLPYLPPPDWQVGPALWAIAIPDFLAIAIRNQDGSYQFSGYLDGRFPSPANRFLVETRHLQRQWLDRIPGWTTPIPPLPIPPAPAPPGVDSPFSELPRVDRAGARAFGRSAELWLAGEIMRAALQHVVVVEDRLRVDCVDLLLHDLRSYRLGGLSIHAATVNERGIVQFHLRHATFFTDPRLLVVVIPSLADGSHARQAFVIPSGAVPEVTTASSDRGDGSYQGSFRLDPIPDRFKPFACDTRELALVILQRLFP